MGKIAEFFSQEIFVEYWQGIKQSFVSSLNIFFFLTFIQLPLVVQN